MARKYKCPYCNKKYERPKLITHINRVHDDMIPEGYTATRIVFDVANPNTKHVCRICGRDVEWNEKAGRYNVLCGNPKCKEAMREEYKKNMIRVKGTYNILNDPEQQKAMLAGRRISGKYKFQDGGVIEYTGTYEKNFLEFLDNVMNIPSSDIMAPGPTMEYEYDGKKHIYIPDFYYIPYNLIIEVKDGGDNPNTRASSSMTASREKTIAKEKVVSDKGEYNYLRLTNNQFDQFIDILMDIKENIINGNIDTRTMKIHNFTGIFRYNESVLNEKGVMDPNTHAYYYNVEKFINGEVSVCFVTGTDIGDIELRSIEINRKCGSKFGVNIIALDTLIPIDRQSFEYALRYKGPTPHNGFTLMNNFLKTVGKNHKTYYDNKNMARQFVRDFVDYVINYSLIHKGQRYIIGGIILPYMYSAEELSQYPVCVTDITKIYLFDNDNYAYLKKLCDYSTKDAAKRNYNLYSKLSILSMRESAIDEEAMYSGTTYFYNGKEFLSNKINLCFIVGFSGSGKTTLAHEYERQFPDIEVEHLDMLVSNFAYSDDEIKSHCPMVYEFLKTKGKKWRLKEEPDDISYAKDMIRDFNQYAIEYARNHRDKRYIVEGIWTLYTNKPEELSDYGVIIIKTSLFTSKIRAAQRNNEYNKGTAIDFIRRLLSNVNDYKQDERLLNDYFYKLVLLNGKQTPVNEYLLTLKPMDHDTRSSFAKKMLTVTNRYIDDNKMEIKKYLSDNGLRNLHPYIETLEPMIIISLVEGDYSGERFKYDYEQLGENIVEYIRNSPEFKKQHLNYIIKMQYQNGKILINV